MKYVGWVVEFFLRNAAGASLFFILAGLGLLLQKRGRDATSAVRFVVISLSVVWVGVLLVLFVNHLRFPLFLDLMEGVVLQHVERLAALQPVYTAPSPEYVPLAYNVGFYVLAVPFSWVLGLSLPTLRLIAMLATIGIAALVFFILKRATGSSTWGLIGTGLFASLYVIMDSYLDTAHSDSCFVLCALAGTAMIDRWRSRGVRLLAVALLVLSFWFKQHGALFAIGGVVFLTLDEGWRKSLPYWLLAVVLGPVAYLFAGPALFGPEFHYFTYEVPSAWSEVSLRAFLRFSAFFGLHYVWLVLAAGWWFVETGPWRMADGDSVADPALSGRCHRRDGLTGRWIVQQCLHSARSLARNHWGLGPLDGREGGRRLQMGLYTECDACLVFRALRIQPSQPDEVR